MTFAQRLPTLLLVLATTTGATIVVLVFGGFGATIARLTYDAIAAGALILWLGAAAIGGNALPRSGLIPAIGACLAAFALTTLTSRVPRLSLEILAYSALLAGLYLLAVALLRRPPMRAHVARLALLFTMILCGWYLLEVLTGWRTWWEVVGSFVIPPLRPAYAGLNLGSPNPVAVLVLLLGSFAAAAVPLRGRRGALLALLLALFVGIVVLLTASRGAWLGTAVAVLVTGAAAWIAIPGVRERVRALVSSGLGKVAAVVVAGALVAAAGIAGLAGRLTLVDEGRQVFNAVSFRMFESSPLTGTGPGTWPALRASYTTPAEIDAYAPHAHSVYWQLLAEIGLVGVIAAVIVAVSVVALIVRALRSDDSSRRRVALATVFCATLLAVHQLVDMFINIPPVLFAIGLPIAWMDATSDTQGPAAGPPQAALPRRTLALSGACLVAVIWAWLVQVESAALANDDAVAAANVGRWELAATLAQQAALADPELGAYQFTLGVSAANAGNLGLAESALTRSTEIDDYSVAWLDLAAVRWKLGDHPGARLALSNAERLGLQRAAVALPAGWLRQQLRDEASAVADYSAALLRAPTLAADPFWRSTSAIRSAWPDTWASARAGADPRTRLVLELAVGEYQMAAEVADQLADADPALYGLIVGAWEGDTAAWASLQALAAQRPRDQETLIWAQLIAEKRQDRAAVGRFMDWIGLVGSPSVTRLQLARVSGEAAQLMPPSVFDSYELVYRRRVPAAPIVQLLPQVMLGGGN